MKKIALPESALPAPSDRQGIQVISRAAAMLRALEKSPQGMSLGELSKQVNLPRSTVQRIVDALDNEGLVLAASTAAGVRLGPALLTLAAATQFEIAEAARDSLEAIASECGETVDLSIVDQNKIVFIDQVSGTHRLTAHSSIGGAFPLYSSANGKAALAAMSEEELSKIKRFLKFKSLTKNTITDFVQLDIELELIRNRTVAYDREENSVGISAVAAAIRSPFGELAAISIPVPTQRFDSKIDMLTEVLLKHTAKLHKKLSRR